MAKRRRARRAPSKRALTEAQVGQQIERFSRLLEKGIAKAAQQLKRVDSYRKKLKYYTNRASDLRAARQAAADEIAADVGRELRPVSVDPHG